MLAYSDKSWVGFTLDHLRYFSQEFAIEGTYLPFRYSLYGGGKFIIYGRLRKQKEESVSLASNFLAQVKIKYLDLRTYYTLEPLAFGIWFRWLAVFPKKQNLGALSFLVNYKIRRFQGGIQF